MDLANWDARIDGKKMLTNNDSEETKIDITYCYKNTIC